MQLSSVSHRRRAAVRPSGRSIEAMSPAMTSSFSVAARSAKPIDSASCPRPERQTDGAGDEPDPGDAQAHDGDRLQKPPVVRPAPDPHGPEHLCVGQNAEEHAEQPVVRRMVEQRLGVDHAGDGRQRDDQLDPGRAHDGELRPAPRPHRALEPAAPAHRSPFDNDTSGHRQALHTLARRRSASVPAIAPGSATIVAGRG